MGNSKNLSHIGESLQADKEKNIAIGKGALLTTATDGFFFIGSCPGIPIGIPTILVGRIPLIVDSISGKFYYYTSSSWKELRLSDTEIKTAYETNDDTNAFTDDLLTKVNNIEALADVTDDVNVEAAGAVMESDISTAAMNFVVDEDDLISNSATKVPTQQSVKKYIDDVVAGAIAYQGGYNASTNIPNLDSSPTGINKSYMWTCTVAGTFFTVDLEIGDVVISEIDNPTVESDWTIVNKNLDANSILASLLTVDADDSGLNANFLQGALPDVADTANTVVKRDVNGRVTVDKIVQTAPASGTSPTHVMVVENSNGILQQQTLANFISNLNLALADHIHSTFDRASSVLSGATVFSNIVVTDGIVTAIATRNITPANIGAQAAGTYNTIIGTDADINTSGSTIIDYITVTDGVITAMGTRTLTPADIGAAPLNSPGLTGSPTAPTQTAGNNTTRLATTAFVQAAIGAIGGGFTSWGSYSINTVYRASVDMVVFATIYRADNSVQDLRGYTDSGVGAATLRVRNGSREGSYGSITMNVIKDDYWRVTQTGAGTLSYMYTLS